MLIEKWERGGDMKQKAFLTCPGGEQSTKTLLGFGRTFPSQTRFCLYQNAPLTLYLITINAGEVRTTKGISGTKREFQRL